MALEEDVAGGPEIDFVFVDFAGLEEFGRAGGRFAIAGAEDPSVRFCAKPLGQTSTNFAVKSVSTAVDAA